MRCRAAKIVALLLVFLLVSCKVEMPEGVIPPERMEALLYDYHLTQSMSSSFSSISYKEKLMYIYVYEKHGVSKEMFDSSLVWYSRYPKHMKLMYKNLEARFQSEVDSLADARAVMDGYVNLETAYLAPNSAELWTGHPVKMLSSTPLGNKIGFSFDVPEDSTFLVGDSLVFSFGATFLALNKDSVEQEAYAAITLEYDDNTYSMSGISVREDGRYSVPASRNFNSRLKSMSGYVYYFDNDTTYASRLLLDKLSLLRVHPVLNVGKESAENKIQP